MLSINTRYEDTQAPQDVLSMDINLNIQQMPTSDIMALRIPSWAKIGMAHLCLSLQVGLRWKRYPRKNNSRPTIRNGEHFGDVQAVTLA